MELRTLQNTGKGFKKAEGVPAAGVSLLFELITKAGKQFYKTQEKLGSYFTKVMQ